MAIASASIGRTEVWGGTLLIPTTVFARHNLVEPIADLLLALTTSFSNFNGRRVFLSYSALRRLEGCLAAALGGQVP